MPPRLRPAGRPPRVPAATVISAAGAATRSFQRRGASNLTAAVDAMRRESPVRRARLTAFGALSAVVGAMIVIVATTLGSPSGRAPLASAGRSSHRHCCWIVQRGQTLISIARNERVGLTELERANPRLIPGALRPGQRVRIPADAHRALR